MLREHVDVVVADIRANVRITKYSLRQTDASTMLDITVAIHGR